MSSRTSPSSSTKKRKDVDSTALQPNGSPSFSLAHKKVKTHTNETGKDNENAPHSKKSSKKRDAKGKGRAVDAETEPELIVTNVEATTTSGSSRQLGSAFKVVSASVVLSIPPVFALDPMKGVHEMLDSLVMRYVPALRGVLLAHSSASFLSQTAMLKAECPFAVCTVGFEATVWSPQVGMKHTGKIKLCSPDHVALLVLQTFNVSIPRHHILTDNWEYQYGPAENDPEFGGGGFTGTSITEGEVDGENVVEALDDEVDTGGSWVQKLTGDKLGGKEGLLEFTVIGLTIANQMLSLVGSLQEDPFDPRHVPQPAVPVESAAGAAATSDEEHDVDDEIELENDAVDQKAVFEPLGLGDTSDDDDLEDPFAGLVPAHIPPTQQPLSQQPHLVPVPQSLPPAQNGVSRKRKEPDDAPAAAESKEARKKRRAEEKAAKEARRAEKEKRRKEKEEKRAAKEKRRQEKEVKKAAKGKKGGKEKQIKEIKTESPRKTGGVEAMDVDF